MRSIDIRLICLDETITAELDIVRNNSKGEPATPTQLYELVMKKLLAGVCIFTYVTKDGAYRTAIGTLNPKLIPGNPTNVPLTAHAPTQTYYDLERIAFREFTKENVVGILSL